MNNGKTILVVDDSAFIRKWTVDILRQAGYQAIECADMWIAESIKTHQPNLILMDINMGTARSGVIAAKSLKKNLAANIPIVFYSASRNQTELVEDVNESQADGYIQKGQDSALLLQDVARFIQSAA